MHRWIRRTITVTITESWTLTWDLPRGDTLAIVFEKVTQAQTQTYRALYSPPNYSEEDNVSALISNSDHAATPDDSVTRGLLGREQ